MTEVVHRIKNVVGPDVTDLSKIRIHVSQWKGKNYIQSNYRAEITVGGFGRYDYPTKILTNKVDSLESALLNIIFDGPPPPNADAILAKAMASVQVLVDRATIDRNGRPLVDLSGASSIRIVDGVNPVRTGQLELMRLMDPPPSIVERLDPCCPVNGRPPGRAAAIRDRLAGKSVNGSDLVFQSLVMESATERAIEDSPLLAAARERTGATKDTSWEDKLESALRAARGRTLIVLAHVEAGKVVVKEPGGDSVFSIDLAVLRAKAEQHGAELFLVGCDTVSYIEDNSMNLGVVGAHNSREMAIKLAEALPKVRNLADLAFQLSGPGLTLVAYDKAGGNGYVGASGFARIRALDAWVRVFRILAMKD